MPQSATLPLNYWQRNLIGICWISYAAYYLGRVNLNPALPEMETALGLGKNSLGLLGTGFFWAYAVGQLINGQLGDLVSPRRLVFAGMVCSALLNLWFSLNSAFPILLIIWSVNGFFQATGWGPILRTLSNWLSAEQTRRIATFFGASYMIGNAGSLILTGWLVSRFGWRMAFRAPAILFLIFALLWAVTVRDTPEERGYQRNWKYSDKSKASLTIQTVLQGVKVNVRRYWTLSLAGLFVGFCLVALNTWLPTYFVEVNGVPINQAAALSALSPIAGSVGVVIAGIGLNRFLPGKEIYGLLVVLSILAILFGGFPQLPANLPIAVAGLMIIGAFISATSSLTLSTLPLIIGGQQNASGLAGLIGLSTNFGAGLSAAIVGGILESSNWDTVFFALSLSAFIALILIALSIYLFQTNELIGQNSDD